MLDVTTREKEINALTYCLSKLMSAWQSKEPAVLEVGCGNGYTAEQISKKLKIKLECIDFSKELIQIARKRKLKNVKFKVGNALDLKYANETFDVVFTERCLINILSWVKQKKALFEIHRVLKKGGVYIMIESFKDGLANLNKARAELSLAKIKEPFHNRYFEKKELMEFLKNKFEYYMSDDPHLRFEEYQNFLSTYYFGSRVLYPSLIKPKEPKYNTTFVKFFTHFPSYGNYSPIQMYVVKKI